MQPIWWLVDAAAFGLLLPYMVVLMRRGRIADAQSLAVVLISVVWVQLALVATASSLIRTSSVNLTHAKPMLLALAGGLLAQLSILIDQAVKGTLPANCLAPIFYRALLGMLCALVGLGIVSLPHADVEQVSDQIAFIAGVTAGGMGVSVITLGQSWLRRFFE
jgi:hypothetical protein